MNDRKIYNYCKNVERHIKNSLSSHRKAFAALKKLGNIIRDGNDIPKNRILAELEKIQEFVDAGRTSSFRAERALSIITEHAKARSEAEMGPKDKIPIKEYLTRILLDLIDSIGVKNGRIAEIGGPYNSFLRDKVKGFDYVFLSLYDDDDPSVIQADITNCPHIEDESFDFIFSINVFEHVKEPWNAAKEIVRLLKPGGITFHAAPFSYFYHEAPVDFWRYTPQAFEYLFSDLETILAEFYSLNRRRDNRGSKNNPIEMYGGAQFKPDAFGGWRENWHSFYAGRKPISNTSSP